MGLHYDLILALFSQSKGEVPITSIVGVGMGRINVEFEALRYLPTRDQPDYTAPLPPKGMAPNLIVTVLGKEKKRFAIELETGIPFVDVGKTLRQVKKYKELFQVVVLIMPKEAERYVPVFKNEGIRVYLWTATREYQCVKCKKLTFNATSIKPRCSECNSSERALRYLGIKDAKFEEYTKPLPKPFKDRTL